MFWDFFIFWLKFNILRMSSLYVLSYFSLFTLLRFKFEYSYGKSSNTASLFAGAMLILLTVGPYKEFSNDYETLSSRYEISKEEFFQFYTNKERRNKLAEMKKETRIGKVRSINNKVGLFFQADEIAVKYGL